MLKLGARLGTFYNRLPIDEQPDHRYHQTGQSTVLWRVSQEGEDIPLDTFRLPSLAPSSSSAALPAYRYLLTQPAAMKFSHSLQFNSVPEWTDKYVSYSKLKAAIYQLEKNQTLDDVPASAGPDRQDDIEHESGHLLNGNDNDADKTFVKLLDRELRRINDFYIEKEKQVMADLETLRSDLERAEREDLGVGESDEGSDDEDDDDDDGGRRSLIHTRDTEDTTDTRADSTRRGSRNRRPSLDALFADPRRYNEASREERKLRGYTVKQSKQQPQSPSTSQIDASSPSEEQVMAQPTAAETSVPDVLSLSNERPPANRRRSASGTKAFAAFFKRRPSQRRSLGVVGSDLVESPVGTRSEGTDSSILGEAKSMSVWTAENDYAIDLRITYKRRITDLFVTFSELKQFVQLNETGMKKILKKYDKTLSSNLKDRYLEQVVRPQYAFRPESRERLDELITTLTQYYAKVVTSGDMTLALSQLKGHLREQVVWQRNTVWREMIGIERRAQGGE